MMNFLTNSEDWDCGPVLLVNLIIWAESSDTFSETLDAMRLRFIEQLETDSNGTYDDAMDRELRELGKSHSLSVRRHNTINHERLFRSMDAGAAVVLAHIDISEDWHYSLWFRYDKKLYAVNLLAYSDVACIPFKNDDVFPYLCYKKHKDEKPLAWVITRQST